MPSEEDKKKEFDQEWDEKVQQTAQSARWQEDLQGLYEADYREPLTTAEQMDLVDDMGDFYEDAAKNGKGLADFRAEVDKKVREEGKKAQEYDEVQFYKEVEESLEIRREGRGHVVERMDMDKHLEKQSKEHEKIRRGISDYIVKSGIPKEIKESEEEKVFMENLKRILEIYDEIGILNAKIRVLKKSVSDLEILLVKLKRTPDEVEIRAAITIEQNRINEKIHKKMKFTREAMAYRDENNVVLEAVRRELNAESKLITKKFGGKISSLFQTRQSLIEQLSRYARENIEHYDKRQQIMQEIEEVDNELEKIKLELIKYKSKKWIFHFERLLGTTPSIPLIHRHGQTSSILTESLRKKLTPEPPTYEEAPDTVPDTDSEAT